jgi:hypothetical protein
MAFDRVDTGSAADDGTGDSVRKAFEKINVNFDALAAALLPRLSQRMEFASLRHTHQELVPRLVSDGPPVGAPTMLGAMWTNTAEGRIYLATGTASESDWREIAFVG